MLESMRQNLKSLQIFLWLVIAAFIGTIFLVWGQGGRQGSSGGQNAIAWVNGEPISYASFQNSYRNIYMLYKQMYGDKLTPEAMESLQIEHVAINQLTQTALLVQEAQNYQLSVSDKELVSAIQEMPHFQKDNHFDTDLYKRILSQVNLTPQEFEEQTLEGLLVEKIEHLIKQTVRISDQEVLDDYTAQNEKIEVEGLLVKANKFTEQAEFTDEDIQAYYDAHKESFTTPERIKIRYLFFDPQKLKETVTPTEEEIRQYYEAHESEYDKGKEVNARHILFRVDQDADEEAVNQVKTKAEELLQQIKDGADFAEMAKEYSEDTASGKEGGDLGFFSKGMMIPEFEEAAFALSPGEVSDLVKTQFGFHIIKVEEVREEQDPYGKAKPEIIDRLKLATAKELAAEQAQLSYDTLLDTDNLDETAQKDNLEVHVSDFFAKGEPIDEKTIALPQIQDVAFTLNAEQKFSQQIETPLGYYILEFLELKEPYIPELSEIKENVSEAVRQEKATELAKAEIEKIEQALTDGATWEEIIEQYTAETISPRPFSRRQRYISESQGKSEEFVKVGFTLKDGENSSVIDLSDAFCILRVKDRIGIDMEKFQEEKNTLKQKLLRQKQDTVFREFIEELRQKADIKIKEGLFS